MSIDHNDVPFGEVEDIHMEDLKGCPISPLGHNNGRYYFLDGVGQIREYGFRDFTYNGVASLFNGNLHWLCDRFPRIGRKNKTIDGVFEVDDVTQALMQACTREGLFDAGVKPRGPGVWLKGETEVDSDGLVVHCGDHLLVDGKAQPPGQRIGGAIYTRARKTDPIAMTPASESQARQLMDLIKKWHFKRPDLDPLLVIGFIAQAMLGGAPRWRAHVMVTGQAGSGKTFLAQTVYAALGGAAHPALNNFTQASLYQAFTGEARALVLDEAEPDESHSRVMAVIELLRHMSSGEGAKVLRGSSGGQANDYSITGCAYLSSILQAQLKPQDATRITHIRLEPLPKNMPPDNVRKLEAAMKELKRLSPALRRRMIDYWPEFRERFEIYRAEFMALGADSRAADQMGTLFAGKDTLLYDSALSSERLGVDAAQAFEIIADLRDRREVENEGQQCLNHLLSSLTDFMREGRKYTIGQMLAEAAETNAGGVLQALASYGVRYISAKTVNGELIPAHILIATSGDMVGLRRLYQGTRWQSGGWSQAIGDYYEGAQSHGKTVRFGGAVSKAIRIPADNVIPKEGWENV